MMDCCEILRINGVVTHEHGCPEVRYIVACKWCGQEFKQEERHQFFCSADCCETYNQ